MREFSVADERIVKEMQQLLLKNTADLNLITRGFIYSQFNKVKYKHLSENEGKLVSEFATAFYDSKDMTINIIGDDYRHLSHKILHEMIHSVTNKNAGTIYSKTGFVSAELYNFNKYSLQCNSHIALNEAATEFYTTTFLQDNVYAYEKLVNIYRYISEVCGYEELKQKYFEGDFESFKDTIRKSFHLKDNSLIDILINQMDMMNNVAREKNQSNEWFSFKECCFTLAQMEYQRLKFNNPNLSDKEIMRKIDIDKMLRPLNYSTQSHLTSTAFVSSLIGFELRKLDTLDQQKTLSYNESKDVALGIIDCILNKKPLLVPKDFILKNLPNILLQMNNQIYFFGKHSEKTMFTVYNEFIDRLRNEDRTIDFSQLSKIDKNRAISTILYGVHSASGFIPYTIFKKEDLIDYVNSNRANWNAFRSKDLMTKCIFPILDKIDPAVKSTKAFEKVFYKYAFDVKNKNVAQDVQNFLKDERVDKML